VLVLLEGSEGGDLVETEILDVVSEGSTHVNKGVNGIEKQKGGRSEGGNMMSKWANQKEKEKGCALFLRLTNIDCILDSQVEKYEMMNQTYMEAVFKLLPCMIGENRWEKLGKESQGDFEKMVSKTDEALLLWAIDCYWNVVAVSDKMTYTKDKRPEAAACYIAEGKSTRKNQGWTCEGKAKYNEYYNMVKENRRDKYWYGVVWKTNFQTRWVAHYRNGRKTSDKRMDIPGGQIESMDDL
jgi:hypothetical protein